jgi:hypothetical protein
MCDHPPPSARGEVLAEGFVVTWCAVDLQSRLQHHGRYFPPRPAQQTLMYELREMEAGERSAPSGR